VTPTASDAERFKVTDVALVLAALLLTVREPLGGVVSVPGVSVLAAPLATFEQALSLPPVSTAVTWTE
jgi:hypothetical protein